MVVESRRGLMLWLLALTTPVLLLTTGCTPSVPAAVRHATAVVVFIDFSGSISGQDRVSFRREIESEILSSLAPGDRLLIAPIHDKTLTDFRPLVDATLPAKPDFNGWLNNVLKFNRQAKEIEAQSLHLKEKISAEVAHVFEKRYVSPQTDIFSSLLIAQKLFYDEPRPTWIRAGMPTSSFTGPRPVPATRPARRAPPEARPPGLRRNPHRAPGWRPCLHRAAASIEVNWPQR